ncbi:Por secretion system C-terminal sorting domain-containing protein [Paenimyroides aquimaris]|uniref:Por secretion system C-terminal sorting domain-containing protein n=1 Tax=Paenimyroides marinum TaxID=1159016 RepID=A0A1H6LN57_9FLAO|nr:T9SS type A sorting domain-containing protein [Paenimyroides aquimaris]SEH86846.1 Por secretion system C-terminal sorting domain-containing protein [Paenimyroides aquimaris]
MRRLILVLLLLIPFLNWGQPYSIDWDGSTNVSPWEEVKQTFNVTTQLPCQGTHSLRTRVRGTEGFSTSVLKSPLLFTATGGVITFSFDYKWLVYNSNMNSPVAGPANQIDARWQWSNSTSGPWYTFETIDNISHSPSTNCATKTATFAPKAGKLYVRLIVSNTSAAGDNYFYLDNISVDQGTPPTCFMPDDVYVTNKTDVGFTLNWTATNSTLLDHEFEVRTSGAPGSGTAGLVTTTPPAGPVGTATSVSITGLSASTNYKVYIRSNCDATDSSFWIGIDVTTMCTPPTSTIPTTYNVCGIQPLKMEVTGGGVSFWYNENDSLVAQATNSYTIDPVTKSEVYKVYNGIFGTLLDTIVAGAGVTSATDATPFADTKSQKIQYIYLAEELTAAGFSRGVIKAFGFKVGTSGGTLQRDNFTIHMGETQLEEFPDDNKFIPTNRLKEVKNLGDQLLVSNEVNMFTLDAPFMWDGVSNIVVQVTYSDLTATAVPAATANILSSFGTSNRTLYVKNSVDNMTTIKDKVTGTRLIYRPNGYFDVIEGCFNEPKIINVNFKEAPTLVLSDSIINNCANQPLPKVYVLSGVSDFDTYEWTIEPVDPNDPNDPANDPTHPNHPDNAVAGDENVGWTFNPVSPMTYHLTVKQSNTFPGGEACVNYAEVKVELPASPTMLQLENDYSLCYNDIQELKVDNFINETPNEYLFNGNTTGVTLNNTITGDAITNDTTLFSEGTGSLKLSYGAQTNATLDFSPSINMNNLKSIVVEFDHIAALQSDSTGVMDYGYLEYTTDNGTTWKPFLEDDYTGLADTTLTQPSGTQAMFFTATSYADWSGIQQTAVPTTTPWKTEKFVVPADEFTGTGTFKVRFRIGADGNTQFPGWYIDNVKIKPISNYQVTWTPIANLYYDQNATVPYDGTINTGTVYLKGTSNSLNVPYNVVIENQYGCKTEKNFTVSIGLKEAPVVNDIDSCGPIDVSTTNFGKNPNGVLTYYNSQTSTSPITQITSSGVYYVEQEISKCKSARVPFTVVINPAAPNAVATPTQSFCGSATVNDIAFNAVQGFQMKWYLTATGGTALASTAPINNGTYYGEFTNGTCTSASRVVVNVTVGATPAAISLNDVYICGTSTIDDINVNAATGATVNWYQNIADTTPLANTTVLTTGTYYISQKIGNCESARTAVNVSTIQNLSMPTATTVQTFCGSGTVGDLMATATTAGANVNWYGYSTSDTPLASSTTLVTGTYYVGQSIGDCDSPKRAVSVRILSVNEPVINAMEICGDATVSSLPLNPAQGISYKVYATPYIATEMGQNDVVTTGIYYISKVENGCETARAAVNVTVNARPNAPTGNINQSFPDYAEVKDLKTNEANVVWFESYNDAVNNVNPLYPSTPLVKDKVYYGVIIGTGNCPSLPLAVTVNIFLGLNDLDLASLKYYPNPTDSELTISYKEAIKSIEVYDLAGKQVKSQQFDSDEVRINVSTLAAGTYMVKVHTDTGSQFIKIVKK